MNLFKRTNYKKLLAKYIEHVRGREGVSFLEYWYDNYFTEEELKELRKLDEYDHE